MRKLKLKEVKQFSQPESREAGNGMHVLRFQSHFIQKTQKFNEKGSAEKGGNCMVLELFIKKKKKTCVKPLCENKEKVCVSLRVECK